jgi:hypothetical protein
VVCKGFRLYSQFSDSGSKDYIFRNLRGEALDKYKVGLKLTNHQRDLVAGCALGDASFFAHSLKSAGLHLEQSYEIESHGIYLNHLYGVMKPFVGTPPKILNNRYPHKGEIRTAQSLRFRTYSHPCFLPYVCLC